MQLDVYMEGTVNIIGKLSRADNGSLSFAYEEGYTGMPLSVRLPIGGQFGDAEARSFFANLLQEGVQLDHIADKYRIERSDIAGLLAHLGKECPGALSIVPEGMPSAKTPGILAEDYTPFTDQELAEDVHQLYMGRAPRKNVEFSLAGVQSKIAVSVDHDGRILQPKEGTGAPTTHILKVGNANDEVLVENEFVCLKTAKALGIPVIECEMRYAGGIPYLLVPRYDRKIKNGVVRRLHQEDCCQAIGLPPTMKYQKDGDPHDETRRANFDNLMALQNKTRDPLSFRAAIFDITFFNYLIGNSDAHAKNFALLYDANRPLLAHFYDLVCVAMYPEYSQEFAMRIGGQKLWDDIERDDWQAFIQTAGIRGAARDRILNDKLKRMAENILDTMEQVIQENALSMSRVKLIRDCIGERIHHLNNTMDWSISVETDAFVVQGGCWGGL